MSLRQCLIPSFVSRSHPFQCEHLTAADSLPRARWTSLVKWLLWEQATSIRTVLFWISSWNAFGPRSWDDWSKKRAIESLIVLVVSENSCDLAICSQNGCHSWALSCHQKIFYLEIRLKELSVLPSAFFLGRSWRNSSIPSFSSSILFIISIIMLWAFMKVWVERCELSLGVASGAPISCFTFSILILAFWLM